MTSQLDIFGQSHHQKQDTREAAGIIEDFPASAERPELFLWLAIKRRYSWISQLDDQRSSDLKEFLRDSISLNRRRQELKIQKGVP